MCGPPSAGGRLADSDTLHRLTVDVRHGGGVVAPTEVGLAPPGGAITGQGPAPQHLAWQEGGGGRGGHLQEVVVADL